MKTLDYTTLFQRELPHLWVQPDLTMNPASPWRWRIEDLRTGNLYCPAPTLDAAERFMRAAERKGEATVDAVSLSMCRLLLHGHSVRVPSSRGGPTAGADDSPESPVLPATPGVEPATPRDSLSNVVPIRRRLVV